MVFKLYSDQDIVKQIHSKINSGNLSNSYTSPFPIVFRYSDNYSIGKDSLLDLKLSWASNYIARSSARAKIGDGVLVVARSSLSNKVILFASVITSDIGETTIWKKLGGHKWKFGYGIEKLSQIVSIDEVIAESIMGVDKFSWKYFTGLNFDNWGKTRKSGNAMKNLFDYIVKNYPIKNRSAIIFKNVKELNKKITIK